MIWVVAEQLRSIHVEAVSCTRWMLWTVLDALSGHSDLVGIWPDIA